MKQHFVASQPVAAGVYFVPLVMLPPEMLASLGVQPAVPAKDAAQDRPARRRRRRNVVAPTPGLVARQTTSHRTRGRVAGLYLAKEGEPSRLTESMRRVYDFVRTHKRGVAAKDIVNRLNMPVGTVGWSLGALIKQGAIEHASMQSVTA